MLYFIIIAPLTILSIVFFVLLSKAEKEKIALYHTMAHRLRSPVSIIKWYTELMSDISLGTLNDKQKKYFDQIFKASQKVNEIIDSLAPKRLQ